MFTPGSGAYQTLYDQITRISDKGVYIFDSTSLQVFVWVSDYSQLSYFGLFLGPGTWGPEDKTREEDDDLGNGNRPIM